MTADTDRVRRAARAVGLRVALASGAAVLVGVGVLLAVIARGAHRPPGVGPHPADGDRLVVDVDHVLPWVLGLGALGVVALAFVAAWAARRAVAPLQAALDLQRHFVADASHELRTPLTTLSARVQLAQRRVDRGEDVSADLGELRRDVTVMGDVLTDLLLAAEAGEEAGAAHATSLAEAARAALRTVAPLADEAGVDLRLEVTEDSRVPLPPAAAARLVVALTDNAVQHGAGAPVLVSVGVEGGRAVLRVHDGGPGLGEVDPDALFGRFARAGGETGRRRGFGLGLALVRDLVARADGAVDVERTGPDGTTIRVRLPRA